MTHLHKLFICGSYVQVYGPKDPIQTMRLFINYMASQLGESPVSLGYLYQLTPYYTGKIDGRAYLAFATFRYFMHLTSYQKCYVLKCDEFFSQCYLSVVVPRSMVKVQQENSRLPEFQLTQISPPKSQLVGITSKSSKSSKMAHSKAIHLVRKFGEALPTITFLLTIMGVFGLVGSLLI